MASARSAESLAALAAASASAFSAASSALRSDGDIVLGMGDDQSGGGRAWNEKSDGGAGIKKPARRGPAGALRPIAFCHLHDPMNRVKRNF